MTEPLRTPARMELTWRYAPGAPMARFREALRAGRLEALQCTGCGRRHLPPRPVCGDCGLVLERWVPVASTGVLLAWSVVHVPIVDGRTGQPREVPYGMGLVRLDGADCSLNHYLATCEASELAVGRRVRARWRQERHGSMDDIACFELEETATADAPDPTPGGGDPRAPLELGLDLTFRYAAGRVVGRFLVTLRDEGRLLGRRCAGCDRVACPPRPTCARCGDDRGVLEEVGPVGTLVSWTEQRGEALGLVRLDGADTALLHRLLGPSGPPRIGARCRARFAEERSGTVLDLAGFEETTP